MTQGIRPDGELFASSAPEGELQTFPSDLRGWGITLDGKDEGGNVITDPTNGIPPMEWMNGILNKLSNQIYWNMRHAIPAWLAGSWDAGAFVVSGDWIYYNSSTSETTDMPGTGSNWVKVIPITGGDGYYLKVSERLSEIAADGTDAQAAARENLGLGDIATQPTKGFLHFSELAFQSGASLNDLEGDVAFLTSTAANGPGFDGLVLGVWSDLTGPNITDHARRVQMAFSNDTSTGIDAPNRVAFRIYGQSESEADFAWSEWFDFYGAMNEPPYPVTSVNGKTGAVVIDIPTYDLSAYMKIADADAKYITGIRMANYVTTGSEGVRDSSHTVLTGIYATNGWDNPSTQEVRTMQYQINGSWYDVPYV